MGSKDNLEWLIKALIATIFTILLGVLLAFVGGYLFVQIMFEVLFGY